MAIKVKKDIVDLQTELNAELEALGLQIVYNPDDNKDKKETTKKDKKTTKKK